MFLPRIQPCGGAGVQAKHLTDDYLQRRIPLLNAHDYTQAMNQSEYVVSAAYPFKQINRDITSFPPKLSLCGKRAQSLKSYCVIQIEFSYVDEAGNKQRSPGYIELELLCFIYPCNLSCNDPGPACPLSIAYYSSSLE